MLKSLFAMRSLSSKYLLIALFSATSAFAGLTLDIQSGQEAGVPYSTIHIQEDDAFICQESKNDFFEVTKIECFFPKAPQRSFRPLRNAFFDISSYETPTLYVITVKPLQKIKLYDVISNIAQTKRIDHELKRKARHWMIIGYQKELPLIQKHHLPQEGLNFPIDFYKEDLPAVGALGLNGKPIELDQVEDVSDYLDIRRLYKRELYDQVLVMIDKALQKDPHSIFKSEFLLYKLRILMNQEAYDDVIEGAKAFLREFSGDEAIPEVLLLIANAASKMGMVIDAEYFYDRLLTEHYDSKEATLGLMALGDHALAKGDARKALGYYKRALKKAETKEVASQAAYKLANYYLVKGRSKDAAFYMQKIAQGNIGFLLEDYERTFEIAKEFSDHEAYKEAAQLMEQVLATLDVSDRKYEGLLYQIALWYDQANENSKAYELYKKYLKQFAFGTYKDSVEEHMDKVLFKIGETNTTKELALYDTIQEKYAHEEIANKALYKRAQLYYKLKSYQKVLDLKEALNRLDQKRYGDAKTIILNSAKALAVKALKEKNCKETILLLRAYNFSISDAHAHELYSCSMQENDYAHAVEIAKEHIKAKDLKSRTAWLFDYVTASFKVGDYKTVFVAGQDLLTLFEVDEALQKSYKPKRCELYKEIFQAALALGYEEKAVEMATRLEQEYGLRYEDIEIYVRMAKLARARKDYTMVENYAYKVIRLQKRHQSFTQSPMIEFLALHALKKLNKTEKAYTLLHTLSKQNLKRDAKARLYYELGNLALQLDKKEEAKEAFMKSSKADDKSPWSRLSADALKLL